MSLPDLAFMHWQKPASDQAASLRLHSRDVDPAGWLSAGLTAVVSGKGGVGKTIIVANLAVAAAGMGARVLVVDGDMGLSNLDLLMGLTPKLNVVDVLTGRCSLADALITGPKGIELLPAGSGRHDLSIFEAGGTQRLMYLLGDVAAKYDVVLLDAGAGIGKVVVELATASAHVLLVAIPEPTSYADAYATCKTLWMANPNLEIKTLINCCENIQEGRQVHAHLEMMCDRFLNKQLDLRGVLPRDRRLREAVVHQSVVVEAFPNSKIARCFIDLAEQLMSETGSRNPLRASMVPPPQKNQENDEQNKKRKKPGTLGNL